MYRIKNKYFVTNQTIDNNNINVVEMEFFCDDIADLPAIDAVNGCILAMGSIAYIINTGDFYVLNSDGEWKNSQGEETNASLNASVSDNTRQLSEPVPDSTKAAEATENEPETIDEVTEPITFDKEIESDGTGEIMEEIPEKTSFIEDATVGDENALRDTESH